MGFSISCYFFKLFSSFLEWVIPYETSSRCIIHYFDDFLFVSPVGSDQCRFHLDTFKFYMARFGVPLSSEKTEGPTTVLSFLGIEIDSGLMVFCLPGDKLTKLLDLVNGFCTVKKGYVTANAVPLWPACFCLSYNAMGRIFSCRLSLARRGVSCPEHHIRLSTSLKADLAVWRTFLHSYNGRTCCPAPEVSSDDVSLFTDAAGSIGFGAILGKYWCSGEWPSSWQENVFCRNLTLLELFPIIVAIELWGYLLQNRRVCFYTDNLGVVSPGSRLPHSQCYPCCDIWYSDVYNTISGLGPAMFLGLIMLPLMPCLDLIGRFFANCCRMRPLWVAHALSSFGIWWRAAHPSDQILFGSVNLATYGKAWEEWLGLAGNRRFASSNSVRQEIMVEYMLQLRTQGSSAALVLRKLTGLGFHFKLRGWVDCTRHFAIRQALKGWKREQSHLDSRRPISYFLLG